MCENVVEDIGSVLGAKKVFDETFGLAKRLGKEVIVDPLKDISGASAAEDANALAREQMEEQKAAGLKDREDAKAATAAEQLRASRSAGATRSTTGRTTGLTSASTIGDDERDFLGL